MIRTVGLILLSAAIVWGQKTEVGAVLGYGALASGDTGNGGAVAGAEFCFVCTGRFVPFAEYAHMQSVGQGADIKTFDLVAGGLRIQTRGRVRPFFDAGFAYGVDRYGYRQIMSHGNPGFVLAGGASIPFGRRGYFRPEVRLYGLTGHAVVWFGSGIGLRF